MSNVQFCVFMKNVKKNCADGCKKGTRVMSQQKLKLEILEIKKYIMVHLGKWD